MGKMGIMAKYNFTVSYIKNSFIRRLLMLLALIPLVILNIVMIIFGMVISGFKHLVENTKNLYNSFNEHW